MPRKFKVEFLTELDIDAIKKFVLDSGIRPESEYERDKDYIFDYFSLTLNSFVVKSPYPYVEEVKDYYPYEEVKK